MKTPREILWRRHQAAGPKLDAIRAEVLAGLGGAPAAPTLSWRERLLSLRWHLAGLSAAWMIVVLLNTDHARAGLASTPRASAPAPAPRQVWASLRESRRLLLQYTAAPAVEPPAVPGRRSEMATEQVEV